MKLCKDCKWKKFQYTDEAVCAHSNAINRVDLVSGFTSRYACTIMRIHDHLCGANAKLFEQKESLWENSAACLQHSGKYDMKYYVEVVYGITRYYSDPEFKVLHREDGPAVELNDGFKYWYFNGKRHRIDGPAVECPNGDKAWYINGNPHREDGPAFEYVSGTKFWYIDGKQLTEVEFNTRNALHAGKVVEIDGVKYVLTVA